MMCAGAEPTSGERGKCTGEARGELGRERAGPYPSNGKPAATTAPSTLGVSALGAPFDDETGTIADACEPNPLPDDEIGTTADSCELDEAMAAKTMRDDQATQVQGSLHRLVVSTQLK